MSGRIRAERTAIRTLGGVLVAFLVLPLVALVVTTSFVDFEQGLSHPLVWPALRLSLLTTTISLAITVALGTPLAWALANTKSRWSHAVETLSQLPIVIPPAVAGIALLFAFGSRGLLSSENSSLTGSTAAVVIAQVFVSAPFFIQAATSAFRHVNPKLVVVARTFGARPLRVFFRIAIPLAAPGLVAGAALAWARALGEFGATLMFAGNLEGQTQTLPLAIYTAMEADMRAAQALAIVLVVVAFALLLFVRATMRRSLSAEGRA